MVKALASDVGLGGVYAEELCILSKIDKTTKPIDADKKIIFKALKKLLSTKPEPSIIEDKDIQPIKLLFYEKKESKQFETFNEALDEVFTKVKIKTKEELEEKQTKKQETKIQKIITSQQKIVDQLNSSIKENHEKGELIYTNYQEIDNILKQLKEARKTLSWKDIKEKLKTHKIIKSIDEKNNKIVVEL